MEQFLIRAPLLDIRPYVPPKMRSACTAVSQALSATGLAPRRGASLLLVLQPSWSTCLMSRFLL